MPNVNHNKNKETDHYQYQVSGTVRNYAPIIASCPLQYEKQMGPK